MEGFRGNWAGIGSGAKLCAAQNRKKVATLSRAFLEEMTFDPGLEEQEEEDGIKAGETAYVKGPRGKKALLWSCQAWSWGDWARCGPDRHGPAWGVHLEPRFQPGQWDGEQDWLTPLKLCFL